MLGPRQQDVSSSAIPGGSNNSDNSDEKTFSVEQEAAEALASLSSVGAQSQPTQNKDINNLLLLALLDEDEELIEQLLDPNGEFKQYHAQLKLEVILSYAVRCNKSQIIKAILYENQVYQRFLTKPRQYYMNVVLQKSGSYNKTQLINALLNHHEAPYSEDAEIITVGPVLIGAANAGHFNLVERLLNREAVKSESAKFSKNDSLNNLVCVAMLGFANGKSNEYQTHITALAEKYQITKSSFNTYCTEQKVDARLAAASAKVMIILPERLGSPAPQQTLPSSKASEVLKRKWVLYRKIAELKPKTRDKKWEAVHKTVVSQLICEHKKNKKLKVQEQTPEQNSLGNANSIFAKTNETMTPTSAKNLFTP